MQFFEYIWLGTVFSLTTRGKEAVLHRFGYYDGQIPGDLIDVNGVLYGTTSIGGSASYGTFFNITTTGVEKMLYSFQGGSDGMHPQGGLIEVNGTLYGTTIMGGQTGSGCSGQCGTIFRVSTSGAEKVIYRFAGGSDGAAPAAAPIELNGVLYGTTAAGGGGSSCFLNEDGTCGTIFSVTTGDVETVLYRFVGGTDGFYPAAQLTNVNGTLYGTTVLGGDDDRCCRVDGHGTIFTLSP
jgi:uncharacterized repeat protein (TIGR03803 family)